MDAATVAQVVGGGVVLLHAGVLLSVPYVLMGRGAPYLPTFAKPARIMFNELLPKHMWRVPSVRKRRIPVGAAVARGVQSRPEAAVDPAGLACTSIVDLGSGDGRLVFEAARRGYGRCEGYEINPLLYLFSEAWLLKHRLFGGFPLPAAPMPLREAEEVVRGRHSDPATVAAAPVSLNTPAPAESAAAPAAAVSFYLRDFWNVDLGHADVVIVYGLTPIMERLSEKLWAELQPGALVVSNVFSMPVQAGWRQVGGEDGVFIYAKPLPAGEAEGEGEGVVSGGERDPEELRERQHEGGGPSHKGGGGSGGLGAPSPSAAVAAATATTEAERERARLLAKQQHGGWFFGIANAAAVQHELQTLDRHAQSRGALEKRRRVAGSIPPRQPGFAGSKRRQAAQQQLKKRRAEAAAEEQREKEKTPAQKALQVDLLDQIKRL